MSLLMSQVPRTVLQLLSLNRVYRLTGPIGSSPECPVVKHGFRIAGHHSGHPIIFGLTQLTIAVIRYVFRSSVYGTEG